MEEQKRNIGERKRREKERNCDGGGAGIETSGRATKDKNTRMMKTGKGRMRWDVKEERVSSNVKYIKGLKRNAQYNKRRRKEYI